MTKAHPTESRHRRVKRRRSSPLVALLHPHRGAVSSLAATSFLGASLEAAFLVLITGTMMALVSGNDHVGPLWGMSIKLTTAVAAAVALVFVRLAFAALAVKLSADLTARVTIAQRRRLADSYLLSSWAVQQAEPTGRLQELLTTFVTRVTGAVATVTQAITALLSLLAFLGAGLIVDPLATLAVIVALGVLGAILGPLRQRTRRMSRRWSRANLEFANRVAELGTLGLEMHTYGLADRFRSRIDDLTRQTARWQRRVQILTGSMSPVYATLAYLAILAGVILLLQVGPSRVASTGAVLLLMLRSLSYGQVLASASGSLASSVPFIDQLGAIEAKYAGSPSPSGSVQPAATAPIVARDVGFDYVEGRPALVGLNFTLDHGDVLGVIGPSGAGKSTLAELILGLREPTSGTLSVAGEPMEVIDRQWWSSRVSLVAQDALLITGTVAENIRFFRDTISDSQLREAAARANLIKEIEALPEGFDTHLGERGSQLSGGQRQRLSIARALAGQPDLLVLDEPTSALDSHSESMIRAALADLKGELTMVIIAHRLSTLDFCDRIMVLEDGRMTALETPTELRSRSAFYREALAISGITQ